MFDYNCDLAQEYGVYKNEEGLSIASYMSSVNISAGFHAGDALSIKKALEFARDNSLAIGAHIGFPDIAGFGNRKMELTDEELEAIVLYQIGAISSYAQSMGLEIEHVRCHGAMYEMLNSDIEFAKKVAFAIKKINPWLVLIVGNFETKETLENVTQINCAYEETFSEKSSIREFREGSHKPDTLHFTSLECAKRAHQAKKPTPLNYNKVGAQI
ncbi:LamB/YcsF family protein [bacterium]|nr:LamB/YcsF family protein [bacterium]